MERRRPLPTKLLLALLLIVLAPLLEARIFGGPREDQRRLRSPAMLMLPSDRGGADDDPAVKLDVGAPGVGRPGERELPPPIPGPPLQPGGDAAPPRPPLSPQGMPRTRLRSPAMLMLPTDRDSAVDDDDPATKLDAVARGVGWSLGRAAPPPPPPKANDPVHPGGQAPPHGPGYRRKGAPARRPADVLAVIRDAIVQYVVGA
ncbi:hypothetical protein ACP70R_033996 [Stipagrostis hirtigluma subsp. patula]